MSGNALDVPEAERLLVGGCMLDFAFARAAVEQLPPADISDIHLRTTFGVVASLVARRVEPTLQAVCLDLRSSGALERAGGTKGVGSLLEGLPRIDPEKASFWTSTIREASERRRLVADLEEKGRRLREGEPLDDVRADLAEGHGGAVESGSVQLVRLADVAAERVEWLWHGYIPFAKLTICDGNPGLGKTTLLLDVAARLTRGHSMPYETAGHEPAGVLILTAEDGLGDTVRPRLEVAGADLAKVSALTGVGTEVGFRLPTLQDAPQLRTAIRQAEARLVIIDPVMAFLGRGVDSSRDADVRALLHPLALVAEETGAAVVLVRHLNKSRGGPAVYRGGGSIGVIGAARSGLLVAQDPGDEGRRVLASVKCNLAAPPASLAFRLVSAGDVARVEWEGQVSATAEDLLADPDAGEGHEGRSGAEEFLREALARGPVWAKEVFSDAKAAGVSERTLKRAKRALGVKATKSGGSFGSGDTRWYWELSSAEGGHEGPEIPEGGQGCQLTDLAPLGEVGPLPEVRAEVLP